MIKKITITFTLIFISIYSFSQINYLLINNDYQQQFEKEALETRFFHTNVKPYNRQKITGKAKYENEIVNEVFGKLEKMFSTDNTKKTIIQPIAGTELFADISQKDFPFHTYGGVKFHSEYIKNVSLHADVYANYYQSPSYLTSQIDSSDIIPHNGLALSSQNGKYAYLNANGYLSYMPAEYINFEIGRGKHFFGDGERSLLLSDNSNFTPYAKADVEVWKVKYVYLIAQQKDYDLRFPDDKFSTKYTATHFLSFHLNRFMNISLFETVISSPIDSMGANRGFDVNYMNPVIFFRPVDLSQGSPDNVLVGIGGSLRMFANTQFYGHGILDEFILSHYKAKNGWWGNKYGLQLGVKSFKTLRIENLYSQFEYNFVRPFTYSHSSPITAYGSYGQPLAHPLGANFKEGIAIVNYTYKDFTTQIKMSYSIYGENADTINYGHNIYRSYLDRTAGDEGYFLTDGINTKLVNVELKFWYPLVKDLFYAEAGAAYRKQSSAILNDNNMMFFVGIKSPIQK